jgi:hypothetical protein
MEIKVRHVTRFVDVQVVESSETIDLGVLDDAERDELAGILIDAVYEMGPIYNDKCAEWFADLLAKRGIELSNATAQLRSEAE